MLTPPFTKIKSLLHVYEVIPEHERLMVDVLRQIIQENLPANGCEKISYTDVRYYVDQHLFYRYNTI